jgi:hypothetical protein
MLRSRLVAIVGIQEQSKDARTIYSRTYVKPGYKRMQYHHSYTTTKAYDSLGRMYLGMYGILKL